MNKFPRTRSQSPRLNLSSILSCLRSQICIHSKSYSLSNPIRHNRSCPHSLR